MRRLVALTAAGVTLAGMSLAAGTAHAAGDVRIHDIQGAAHVSPMVGDDVTDVPGVVTAVTKGQFYLQDPRPDDDPATAEALVVFTKDAPGVAVGDSVTVAGEVTEYRPGDVESNLSTTEITTTPDAVSVTSHDNDLPDAAIVGDGGRIPPNRVVTSVDGDVEESATFAPDRHGLDFWESLEGMRIQLSDPKAVGPTNDYGELPVVGDRGRHATPESIHGGVVQTARDGNPERLILRGDQADVPTAQTGDVLDGDVTGVVDYDFGNYGMEIEKPPDVTDGGLRPEVTSTQRAGELSVASFNVENLSPKDPASKFDGLADTIVRNLRGPDIVTVEEVQDDTGPTDDGTVTAGETVDLLTAAIKRAGGADYAWQSIDPEDNADGGQPGGNIRVGFLYREDRGIDFVDAPRGDATTPVDVQDDGGHAALTLNPGRIDPGDDAWNDTRKPLAGQFRWHGKDLFVIANHWSSKGGDDPLMGRYQPPRLASEPQRTAQAKSVAAFVTRLHDVDPDAAVVAAGDLNDFPWSTPVRTFTADTRMTDLPATLPRADRFTYDYEGNSEVLDHILLSESLAARPYRYDAVHVNAEFSDQLSDHDPQVVRLQLA